MGLEERIVNQHNINRASLAGACTTLGCGKAVHQITAQPEHTHTQEHTDAHIVSLSCPSYSLSLSFLHTNKKIHRSDTVRQQGCKKKDRDWPKGVCLSALPHQFQCFIKGMRGPQGLEANLATLSVPKHRTGALSKTEARWLLSLYVTVFIYFVSSRSSR